METKENEDFNISDILSILKEWKNYFLAKWYFIVLGSVLFAGIGFCYGKSQKIEYTASISFAMDDEKGAGGISGAMGLASTLGIDLGTNAGGAFTGTNIMELMRSRRIVEKALLNPLVVGGKQKSLANFYIEINQLNSDWDSNPLLKNISFNCNSDRFVYTRQQDSILGVLYQSIVSPNGALDVSQKDKKISIINIDVKSYNELFSKYFAESIAKEVSIFYIESKSKKARLNVAILQKQSDSVRNALNEAITGVAQANDNVYNLNSSMNIKKTVSTRRQVDVTANTAILTQLVTNLEMAKVSLLKETPLIQIIDHPILPLKKNKVSTLKTMFLGLLFGMFLVLGTLAINKLVKDNFVN